MKNNLKYNTSFKINTKQVIDKNSIFSASGFLQIVFQLQVQLMKNQLLLKIFI
jgi:hypothetical protein